MQIVGLQGLNSDVDLKKMAALFILKTRDGKNLTQTALDGILDDVTHLFQTYIQYALSRTLQV